MNRLPYSIDVSKFQFSKEVDTNRGKKVCFSIHSYYPLNKFGDRVDTKIKQVRALVYGFKDGHNVEKYTDLFFEALTEKKLVNVKSETILIPIPASTSEKTKNRFNVFCRLLSEKLGILNGYGAITTNDHAAFHQGAERSILPHLTFEKSIIQGKEILLVDDVITSGRSFRAVSDKLYDLGAKSVQGIFLAHTTDRAPHGTELIHEGRAYYFDDAQNSYVDLEDFLG